MRWLSRPPWGRIEAPHWRGPQGPVEFYAIFPCNNGFYTTGPSIRLAMQAYSGTAFRYGLRCKPTQGPVADTPHAVRLIRDRAGGG
ncbi:MAG: hypothetical protein N2050_02030 [Flavobacteriales bacterium]|nr:hypothetical protein [Flavobacteriales bacterium]